MTDLEQLVQTMALEPESVPAGQATQAEAPWTEEKVPAPQEVQAGWPSVGA